MGSLITHPRLAFSFYPVQQPQPLTLVHWDRFQNELPACKLLLLAQAKAVAKAFTHCPMLILAPNVFNKSRHIEVTKTKSLILYMRKWSSKEVKLLPTFTQQGQGRFESGTPFKFFGY